MPSPLVTKTERERAYLNGWSTFPSAAVAEMFAQIGLDSITLDMQHGLHDYASVIACLQAMNAYDVTPIVRVPWNEPGILGKVLDGGAWGVICPMINTREEAEALARACLYPPLGQRSNGPFRASLYGDSSPYQATANQKVSILPQIETRDAVANVDEILNVAGISGFYIGPSDLGLSLGLAGTMDREEAEILAIYETLLQAAKRRGLIAGIHNATPAYALRMIEMGFDLVTIASDVGLLLSGGRRAVGAMRGGKSS